MNNEKEIFENLMQMTKALSNHQEVLNLLSTKVLNLEEEIKQLKGGENEKA